MSKFIETLKELYAPMAKPVHEAQEVLEKSYKDYARKKVLEDKAHKGRLGSDERKELDILLNKGAIESEVIQFPGHEETAFVKKLDAFCKEYALGRHSVLQAEIDQFTKELKQQIENNPYAFTRKEKTIVDLAEKSKGFGREALEELYLNLVRIRRRFTCGPKIYVTPEMEKAVYRFLECVERDAHKIRQELSRRFEEILKEDASIQGGEEKAKQFREAIKSLKKPIADLTPQEQKNVANCVSAEPRSLPASLIGQSKEGGAWLGFVMNEIVGNVSISFDEAIPALSAVYRNMYPYDTKRAKEYAAQLTFLLTVMRSKKHRYEDSKGEVPENQGVNFLFDVSNPQEKDTLEVLSFTEKAQDLRATFKLRLDASQNKNHERSSEETFDRQKKVDALAKLLTALELVSHRIHSLEEELKREMPRYRVEWTTWGEMSEGLQKDPFQSGDKLSDQQKQEVQRLRNAIPELQRKLKEGQKLEGLKKVLEEYTASLRGIKESFRDIKKRYDSDKRIRQYRTDLKRNFSLAQFFQKLWELLENAFSPSAKQKKAVANAVKTIVTPKVLNLQGNGEEAASDSMRMGPSSF